MKIILKTILAILARLTLLRFKPRVIGITGSVGKTSAKEAIALVLSSKYSVGKSPGNYNNEIGLPLSVLQNKNPERNIFGWIILLIRSLLRLIAGSYPQVLVLEMGADRPGDISYLLRLVGKLDFAIITDIGISHMEFYPSEAALVKEKFSITKAVGKDGFVVANFDSPKVYDNKNLSKFDVFGFGFHVDAIIHASDFQIIRDEKALGVNFKVHYKDAVVPFFIPNTAGKPVVYSALCAIAVGVNMGLNLVEISEKLKEFAPPAGRLKIIAGIKNTTILDDSYNAAPASTIAALDTLNMIATGRKLAVIGSQAELGKTEAEGLRQIAVGAIEAGVTVLFLVGSQAQLIKLELEARKFSGKILLFADADMSRIPIQNALMSFDTILVKGSQLARMEKIVYEIMRDPMDAQSLLVRQSEKWLRS